VDRAGVTLAFALADWGRVAASRPGSNTWQPARSWRADRRDLLHPSIPFERTFFLVALTVRFISDIFLMLPQDNVPTRLGRKLWLALATSRLSTIRPLQPVLLCRGGVESRCVRLAVILPPDDKCGCANQPGLVWPVTA